MNGCSNNDSHTVQVLSVELVLKKRKNSWRGPNQEHSWMPISCNRAVISQTDSVCLEGRNAAWLSHTQSERCPIELQALSFPFLSRTFPSCPYTTHTWIRDQKLWIRDLIRLQDGCQGSPGCSAVNQNEAPRNQETTKKQSYPWLPLQSVMPLQSGATYSGGNRLRLPTNLCFAYARCADIPSLTITRCWSAGLMNKTVRNPCIKSLNIFCFLF